jgi:hypothetical protein
MEAVETDSCDAVARELACGKQDREAKRVETRAPTSPNGVGGILWFGGWLFTIGYLQLGWWKAILALIVWPYFIGANVH